MWALDAMARRWTLLKGEAMVRYMTGAEAYDAESDRIVVQDAFGGDTMVLDADLEHWERKDICQAPVTNGTAMAYDAESDRMILFGGFYASGSQSSDETWAYDYNTDTWTQMEPEIVPPARSDHVMVYDGATDRVYMWGGWPRDNMYDRGPQVGGSSEPDPATFDRQVWAYDYNDDAWMSLGDAGAPQVTLADAGAAHHPATGRMILFGGLQANSYSDQTWAYSYQDQAWAELLTDESPSPRRDHSMAYDSSGDKIVLFGGATGDPEHYGRSGNYSDELWLFDPKADQWSQVTPVP